MSLTVRNWFFMLGDFGWQFPQRQVESPRAEKGSRPPVRSRRVGRRRAMNGEQNGNLQSPEGEHPYPSDNFPAALDLRFVPSPPASKPTQLTLLPTCPE